MVLHLDLGSHANREDILGFLEGRAEGAVGETSTMAAVRSRPPSPPCWHKSKAPFAGIAADLRPATAARTGGSEPARPGWSKFPGPPQYEPQSHD